MVGGSARGPEALPAPPNPLPTPQGSGDCSSGDARRGGRRGGRARRRLAPTGWAVWSRCRPGGAARRRRPSSSPGGGDGGAPVPPRGRGDRQRRTGSGAPGQLPAAPCGAPSPCPGAEPSSSCREEAEAAERRGPALLPPAAVAVAAVRLPAPSPPRLVPPPRSARPQAGDRVWARRTGRRFRAVIHSIEFDQFIESMNSRLLKSIKVSQECRAGGSSPGGLSPDRAVSVVQW